MRSDTPRPESVDEQLRALGRQLDQAAPAVEPHELSEATPTAEVAHLVAVDPDATGVIPLLPVPGPVEAPDPRRRRIRVLGAAAAAAVVLAAGGVAVALAADDDEVRTDQAAQLEPVTGPVSGPDEAEVDLGGFGEVAESFGACMEGAGFTAPSVDGEGFEGFEDLAGMLGEPGFFDALRACTASSGLADLDIGAELEELDIEGTLEEQLGDVFGGTVDETISGMLDDVFTQLESVDMAEVTAQVDAWLAELDERAPELEADLRELGADADQVVACMQDRGWTAQDPGSAEHDPAAIEQLLVDLRECTEQG